MAVGQYDVSLNGTKFLLDRKAEKAYRRSIVAAVAAAGQVTAGVIPTSHYRQDILEHRIDDWSGGALWWKPRTTSENSNAYFLSDGFDTWSTPGKARVLPKWTSHSSDLFATGGGLLFDGTNWWLVGDAAATVGDTSKRMLLRSAGTVAFVEGAFDSGCDSDKVWCGAFDESFSPSRRWWLNNTTTAANVAYATNTANGVVHVNAATLPDTKVGATLLLWQGRLLYWNGDILYDIDKSTVNTIVAVSDSGTAPSLLGNISQTPAGGLFDPLALREAVVGDDGVYYVKTITGTSRGDPQPVVYRFSTDGVTDFTEEITRLPVGTIVLNCYWHLGSLLLLATPDVTAALANAQQIRCALYHVTNRIPGAIGYFDGELSPSTVTVAHFLGSEGPLVWLAGNTGMYVYDAIRGGVHRARQSLQNMVAMGLAKDAGNNPVRLFVEGLFAALNLAYWQPIAFVDALADYDTAFTAFLETNYFDFDLPDETKQLLSVVLETDTLTSGDGVYTVKYSLNDAAFVSAGTMTAGTRTTFDLSASSLTFRNLRLRLEYVPSLANSDPASIKSVLIRTAGQDFVRVWDMMLDGESAVNAGNEPIRPTVAFDAIDGLAATNAAVVLIDGFRSGEVDDSSTHRVRVVSAEIGKGTLSESQIRVQLVEAV